MATADFIYNVNATVTPANSNAILAYTYATGSATTTTYNPITASVTYGSSMDTQLIDALFLLKPKLRKKYHGDREKFRHDMLAAARAQEQAKAVKKLSDLLDIEA